MKGKDEDGGEDGEGGGRTRECRIRGKRMEDHPWGSEEETSSSLPCPLPLDIEESGWVEQLACVWWQPSLWSHYWKDGSKIGVWLLGEDLLVMEPGPKPSPS